VQHRLLDDPAVAKANAATQVEKKVDRKGGDPRPPSWMVARITSWPNRVKVVPVSTTVSR